MYNPKSVLLDYGTIFIIFIFLHHYMAQYDEKMRFYAILSIFLAQQNMKKPKAFATSYPET